MKVPQKCSYCKSSFLVEVKELNRGFGKFCSRKCSHKGRDTSYLDRESNVVCALCGVSFYRNLSKQKNSTSGLFFCCRAHKDEAQKAKNAILIPAHYKQGKCIYRSTAFEHYDRACGRCGWKELPEILQVHHKDRDRTNSKVENLEVLCPNCHLSEHFLTKSGLYHTLS